MTEEPKKRPRIVDVVAPTYQPSKAELEEDCCEEGMQTRSIRCNMWTSEAHCEPSHLTASLCGLFYLFLGVQFATDSLLP